MTAATLTRSMTRPAPALACQKVGGCSARATITAMIVVAVLVAASLLCVWSRTEVVRQGYALSELAAQLNTLSAEGERLKAEAATLKSPDRIESIARARLGMQFPGREQIRVVETGSQNSELYLARNRTGWEGGKKE